MASGRRQLSSVKQQSSAAADKRQQAKPRINPIKRTRPGNSLRDVIRNQQYIIRQYEQLQKQGIFRRRGRLTNLTLHNTRRPKPVPLTSKSARLSRRRTPQRKPTALRNNPPPQNVKRRRPLGRGSPNNNKRLNATDLDAQLDQYMGDDVRKARLDTELDAYFSRSDNSVLVKSVGDQSSELGEIASQ